MCECVCECSRIVHRGSPSLVLTLNLVCVCVERERERERERESTCVSERAREREPGIRRGDEAQEAKIEALAVNCQDCG